MRHPPHGPPVQVPFTITSVRPHNPKTSRDLFSTPSHILHSLITAVTANNVVRPRLPDSLVLANKAAVGQSFKYMSPRPQTDLCSPHISFQRYWGGDHALTAYSVKCFQKIQCPDFGTQSYFHCKAAKGRGAQIVKGHTVG